MRSWVFCAVLILASATESYQNHSRIVLLSPLIASESSSASFRDHALAAEICLLELVAVTHDFVSCLDSQNETMNLCRFREREYIRLVDVVSALQVQNSMLVSWLILLSFFNWVFMCMCCCWLCEGDLDDEDGTRRHGPAPAFTSVFGSSLLGAPNRPVSEDAVQAVHFFPPTERRDIQE